MFRRIGSDLSKKTFNFLSAVSVGGRIWLTGAVQGAGQDMCVSSGVAVAVPVPLLGRASMGVPRGAALDRKDVYDL